MKDMLSVLIFSNCNHSRLRIHPFGVCDYETHNGRKFRVRVGGNVVLGQTLKFENHSADSWSMCPKVFVLPPLTGWITFLLFEHLTTHSSLHTARNVLYNQTIRSAPFQKNCLGIGRVPLLYSVLKLRLAYWCSHVCW